MDPDLNINNYTIGDLKSFFKINLKRDYTNEELNKKVSEMELVISLLPDTSQKFKTLDFIEQAKQILYKKDYESEEEEPGQGQGQGPGPVQTYNPNSFKSNLINKNENTTQIPIKMPDANPETNVGTILTPLSNHQPLQTTYISNTKPLQYDHFITNYTFNTRYRDNFYNTTTNNCTFTLPITLKNVISISLSALQYPNVMWSFTNSIRTTQIYIKEDTTNNEAVVVIPEGNYDFITMPPVLEKAINEQVIGLSGPNRFSVKIDFASHQTTISNSTYTFSMGIITHYNILEIACKTDNSNYLFKDTNDDPKTKIRPEELYNTLGYLLGYREFVYTNQQSYTTESIFESTRFHYVYFALNDYVGNYNTTNVGIFPNSVVNKNILALIPITSPDYTTTFADGSTYIYRTRNYNGPVNIKKISIQLFNPVGQLAVIHNCEYAFCLQVKTIANMTKPYSYNDGS